MTSHACEACCMSELETSEPVDEVRARARPGVSTLKMLSGRLAIVTGATSGIGAATARLFVQQGARVVGVGRNKAALNALQQETGCGTATADITAPHECERAVSEAVAHLGGLTTLVNCAGVLMPGAIGSTASLKDFEHNFSGNTRSVFEMMQHSIPHMQARAADGSCSIVNISSVNGLQSFGGVATYCAAKAAVDMLSKCAALDLAPSGIRVNAVNPGLVLTELQKRGGLNDEQYAALVKRSLEVTHPLFQARGRAPEAVEVAELIAFLASDKASFITGDSIKIDGGRTCVGAR